MKFKVGDRVIIKKSIEEVDRNKYISVIDPMLKYRGTEAIIKKITRELYSMTSYTLDIDNGRFAWHEDWLEKIPTSIKYINSLDKEGDHD